MIAFSFGLGTNQKTAGEKKIGRQMKISMCLIVSQLIVK